MKSKSLVVVILIIISINSFVTFNKIENCRADILPKFYVDDDFDNYTPGWQVDHFDSIQDAIDASSAGDRIVVYAGTYNERLTITHKLDIFGEDKNITFIDGGDTSDVVNISAEYVNISHFTIRDSGNGEINAMIIINSGNAIITDNKIISGKHGVSITNCDYNIIYDNIITSNSGNGVQLNNSDGNEITYNIITSNLNGLFLHDSSNNIIQNNLGIKSNSINGLFLNETCDYNTISYNNISSNTENGIFLNDHCNYNTLSNNDIYSNSDSGIRLENSSINKIDNSTINSNSNYGVMIVGSSNDVWDSIINSNAENGVFLFADDNNVIAQNTITGNLNDGISLSNSTLDRIYKNEIAGNSQYGIQLDYFTLQNIIYNNHLHNNINNAIDKSIGKNLWNTTKTVGTNIVGGSYIYGNYWDNFDETSEGAKDNNGNGIADSAYTIYGANKDYGPLLDIIPPSLSTPQVSPSQQTIGKYTYISITITDNTEIKEVYLNYTDPYGEINNLSITQNKNGNNYYCNKQFSPIGTYTFHITVKDPRNWANTKNKTFYINKGTPPTILDNTPSKGSPSKTFTFKATVADNEGSTSGLIVKVQWSHKDKGGNNTLINNYQNSFITSVTLDNSTEDLLYVFYAVDKWGNSITTSQKSVKVVDNEPPSVIINKYGASSDNMPNKFTFNATITDNVNVQDVTIEYWYAKNEHIITTMDNKGNNYYEKNVQLSEAPNRVYCIIYATDSMGNSNDTKNPFANASGPYTGIIAIDINFSAEQSFDLDGDITRYDWDFGDGTTGSGETTNHIFTSNGNYTITLTVTDDNGNKGIAKTYALIKESIIIKTNFSLINKIQDYYEVNLSELFYCYDTDGDSVVDRFIDPNNVLKEVKTSNINISGNISFLLSINDDYIPEFMWNATTNEIVNISHTNVPIDEKDIKIDQKAEKATVSIIVSKAKWICVETDDKYPYSTVTVSTGSRIISSDMIWRKNNKIYFLDDPDTIYTIVFSDIYPKVESPTISPGDGSIINENQTTITITYNIPVTIISATFETLNVRSALKTTDIIVYTYTPPGYLEDGIYNFQITAKALQGDSQDTSTVTYFYYAYIMPPPIPEKSFIEKNLFFIILSIIGGAGAVLYILLRFNYINFESFVYFKNKKIIPFFKPLVFGPLRIDVNDERVKKAEFYVNGKLKDTITKAPYVWNWNENAFMKQKIETKIYDEEGNSSSSGEMTFFVFNSPRLFK